MEQIERIQRKLKVYFGKKYKETAKKEQTEKIKAIVKSLIIDKTTKESIEMFKELSVEYNKRLDTILKQDLESVTEISKYKGINI